MDDAAEAAAAVVVDAIASARPCVVEPIRWEAADPRVGESRAGASLGRRDPDRPVTPAMVQTKMRKWHDNEAVAFCDVAIETDKQ